MPGVSRYMLNIAKNTPEAFGNCSSNCKSFGCLYNPLQQGVLSFGHMFHPHSDRQFQDEKSCGSKVPKGKCKKTTMWSSPLCNNACSFMVKIITIKTRFVVHPSYHKVEKTKGSSSANPQPPTPFKKISPKSKLPTTPKKKILIFSGLNFPAAKRPRLSEWAEGYAGLRMKALQGAGRHRSLSTPELPMSVVGGLRRWSARLLKPPMEEPQEADDFLMMGFLGDVGFFFSIKHRMGSRKGGLGHFLPEIGSFTVFFFQMCLEVEIWWGMWDSDLEKKRGFLGFWRFELKIGDRNWRAKVVYFNRSSGVSGPDVTPKIIHGAKHVLKFNR